MPYKTKKKRKRAKGFHCRACGRRCPSKYKTFKTRMAWLRRHRKGKHPKAHKKSVKKTLKTKRERGLIE